LLEISGIVRKIRAKITVLIEDKETTFSSELSRNLKNRGFLKTGFVSRNPVSVQVTCL